MRAQLAQVNAQLGQPGNNLVILAQQARHLGIFLVAPDRPVVPGVDALPVTVRVNEIDAVLDPRLTSGRRRRLGSLQLPEALECIGQGSIPAGVGRLAPVSVLAVKRVRLVGEGVIALQAPGQDLSSPAALARASLTAFARNMTRLFWNSSTAWAARLRASISAVSSLVSPSLSR